MFLIRNFATQNLYCVALFLLGAVAGRLRSMLDLHSITENLVACSCEMALIFAASHCGHQLSQWVVVGLSVSPLDAWGAEASWGDLFLRDGVLVKRFCSGIVGLWAARRGRTFTLACFCLIPSLVHTYQRCEAPSKSLIARFAAPLFIALAYCLEEAYVVLRRALPNLSRPEPPFLRRQRGPGQARLRIRPVSLLGSIARIAINLLRRSPAQPPIHALVAAPAPAAQALAAPAPVASASAVPAVHNPPMVVGPASVAIPPGSNPEER